MLVLTFILGRSLAQDGFFNLLAFSFGGCQQNTYDGVSHIRIFKFSTFRFRRRAFIGAPFTVNQFDRVPQLFASKYTEKI